MTESDRDRATQMLNGVRESFGEVLDRGGSAALGPALGDFAAVVSANAGTATAHAVLDCGAALRDMAATAEAQLITAVLTTRCIPLNRQEERQLENKLRAHLGIEGARD